MSPQISRPLPGRQRGAALVTGLLIMIIMTLVGIATMESSIIQTNLASNSQLNAIGFQTTESALTRASNDAPRIGQALTAGFNNNPGPKIDYPQQNITLDKKSGGTVTVDASAQVNLCGNLLPSQSPGTGQNANQNALNPTPTEYAYTYTAITNVGVGGQAITQHVMQTRIPAPSQQGLPGAGNVGLCQI